MKIGNGKTRLTLKLSKHEYKTLCEQNHGMPEGVQFELCKEGSAEWGRIFPLALSRGGHQFNASSLKKGGQHPHMFSIQDAERVNWRMPMFGSVEASTRVDGEGGFFIEKPNMTRPLRDPTYNTGARSSQGHSSKLKTSTNKQGSNEHGANFTIDRLDEFRSGINAAKAYYQNRMVLSITTEGTLSILVDL